MQRAPSPEPYPHAAEGREAESSVSRPEPLTLVAEAVAGEDLTSVASRVAAALGSPVVIAIPALGEPVVAPAGALAASDIERIAGTAIQVGIQCPATPPAPLADAVPVRIGEQVVGIVAATLADPPAFPGPGKAPASERRAWLEAAAAAASVTARLREATVTGNADSSELLLSELAAGPSEDLPGLLLRARRLGVDLAGGVVVISARGAWDARSPTLAEFAARPGTLIAELPGGRILAVTPAGPASDAAVHLADGLRAGGMAVGMSAPRRDPSLLHEGVREAQLLAEIAGQPGQPPAGPDDTYRLLIRVLLRDRSELEQLRDSTVTPLAGYDDRHDTDLLATLRAFLAHDGSTTETAEAMNLHRHTVGYRLSRVHEVSGLSPYESDGRERLSLGIKAHQILDAERRLARAGDPPA